MVGFVGLREFCGVVGGEFCGISLYVGFCGFYGEYGGDDGGLGYRGKRGGDGKGGWRLYLIFFF